jgi:maltooligosyltrehalose synthase
LRGLPDVASEELLGSWRDGRIKQLAVRNLMRWRSRIDLTAADYVPLEAAGDRAAQVLAFARRGPGGVATCIVPVRPGAASADGGFAVGDVWADTAVDVGSLGATSFTDVLTGTQHEPPDGRLVLRDVLATLPVAVLHATTGEH